MPFENLVVLILFVLFVASMGNILANWRLQSTVRELGRLLASRSFTDYAVGVKKLEAPPKKPVKHEPGYETVFEALEEK